MKLLVLGAGGAVPDGRTGGPGFWVEAGDTRLLLDCGAGVLPSLAKHVPGWCAITHVFLSHFHIDHIVELPALLFGLGHAPGARSRTEPLEVLGPPGTADLLTRWESALDRDFTNLPFDLVVEDLRPGASRKLGPGCSLHVTGAFHTQESLAVRVEERGSRLGYTGDTAAGEGLAAFFAGCDVLVADCSLAAPSTLVEHMSVDEAAALARDAGVAHLVATHLHPEQDPPAVERRLGALFGGRVSLAREGLVIGT